MNDLDTIRDALTCDPPEPYVAAMLAISRLRTAILTANAQAHADGSIPAEDWKRVLECVEGKCDVT